MSINMEYVTGHILFTPNTMYTQTETMHKIIYMSQRVDRVPSGAGTLSPVPIPAGFSLFLSFPNVLKLERPDVDEKRFDLVKLLCVSIFRIIT